MVTRSDVLVVWKVCSRRNASRVAAPIKVTVCQKILADKSVIDSENPYRGFIKQKAPHQRGFFH
jgi:hypothetical protein